MERSEIAWQKMCDLLRIIGYPQPGTWEEQELIYAADCAKLVQDNFSIDDLTSPARRIRP